MLSGVDQSVVEEAAGSLASLDRPDDWRDLHEVGASAGDEVNTFHGSPYNSNLPTPFNSRRWRYGGQGREMLHLP
jgi:hypothetical protein